MSKELPLDFDRYPALWDLFTEDKEQFLQLVKGTLANLNKAVEHKDHVTSKETFQLSYEELNKALMEALFDYEGIINHHYNDAEKEAMKVLQHEMNPLAVFTGESYAIDAKGKQVPTGEWSGASSVKDFFQSLLYGARFVPLSDLAAYLSLGQYELIDVLKARNFKELASIQPALKYQEDNSLMVGKLLQGTGYFDCGDEATKLRETCPACQSAEWNIENNKYAYCPRCKAGGLK